MAGSKLAAGLMASNLQIGWCVGRCLVRPPWPYFANAIGCDLVVIVGWDRLAFDQKKVKRCNEHGKPKHGSLGGVDKAAESAR